MRAGRLLDELPAITSVSVLGAGFLALGLGYSWFWMVWVVGFVSVVPLAAIVSDALLEPESAADASQETQEEDALAVLRERYAEGKIDEAEFERRLEALLDTETVDEARERATEGARSAPVDHEVERDRP